MAETILAFADLHLPYEDKEVLSVFKQAVEYYKPHRTISLGDMLDCELFSQHGATSVGEAAHDYIEHEINPANELLDFIQHHTKRKTICVEGNHCFRISRWAAKNCGKLDTIVNDALSPQRLLSEGRKNFEYIPYIQANDLAAHYKVNKHVLAIHGWSCAQNVARTHLLKGKGMSVIHGHAHKTELIFDKSFDGRIIFGMSLGPLCGLSPTYTAKNGPTSWTNSFGVIFTGSEPSDVSPYVVLITKTGKGKRKKARAVLPCGKILKS